MQQGLPISHLKHMHTITSSLVEFMKCFMIKIIVCDIEPNTLLYTSWSGHLMTF